MTKRILNIVPLVSDRWNEMTRQALGSVRSPGFEYDVVNVTHGGMESIEGLYYIAVTVPYIVDRIIEAEQLGYDAVTSLCFGNPGVKEGREMVDIPVIGAGEAALYTAMMCGERIGIVTVGATYRSARHGAMLNEIRRMCIGHGIADRVVSYRTTGSTVEECGAGGVFEELRREAAAAIDDGADVIVLGCTGMVGMSTRLQESLQVPVIDPNLASVKYAEMLLSLGLSHSKLATPAPAMVGSQCVLKWPPTLRNQKDHASDSKASAPAAGVPASG